LPRLSSPGFGIAILHLPMPTRKLLLPLLLIDASLTSS